MIVNKTDLAEIFEVSTRTVDRWIENGLAHEKRLTTVMFDIFQVHQFLLKQYRASLLKDENETNGKIYELDYQRARLAETQRLKITLDIAERKRQLIDPSDMSEIIKLTITNAKNKLLSVSSKAASRLNLDESQEQIIASLISDVLVDLAKSTDSLKNDL